MGAYLLVNFGGPRWVQEIEPFLRELLCDRDVIRTQFPSWLHDWIFRRAAKKRALKVSHDYEKIGGSSPIYSDTETLRTLLQEALGSPVLTFHRYLPATHAESLSQIETSQAKKICALPLFPQFCYATTGSIARFFSKRLSIAAESKLRWIKSYAVHPAFISAWQNRIARFLEERRLLENEAFFLFSAHGVPRSFIDEGDPYEEECKQSFSSILERFPNAMGRLAYQSKFGRGEWLCPYTEEECWRVLSWYGGRRHIVFVPFTFTSDHIETLFEIEELYLPLIRAAGLNAYRCPALNLEPDWVSALAQIAKGEALTPNRALIR